MIRIKNIKQGFTLLELLVVVLIIGILASIALPQYNKAVEKAKLSEALLNIKAIEESIQRYRLSNDCGVNINLDDVVDIELSGGEWDVHEYYTDNGIYGGDCGGITFIDKDYNFVLERYVVDIDAKTCYTNDTDKGRFICKYLEPLGWDYVDEGY